MECAPFSRGIMVGHSLFFRTLGKQFLHVRLPLDVCRNLRCDPCLESGSFVLSRFVEQPSLWKRKPDLAQRFSTFKVQNAGIMSITVDFEKEPIIVDMELLFGTELVVH